MNINFKNYNSGQAMIISVIFFLFISMAIILGLISPVAREFKIARDLISSKQSYFLAESGIEDIFYRHNANKQISSSENIVLGDHIATTIINNLEGNEKEIISLGDVNGRQRRVNLKLKAGTGVSFNYGIQAGNGGFVIGSNAGVFGNVYSGGDILGSNGAFVTGSVIASDYSTIDKVTIGVNGIGDAWANEVTDSNIANNLYCQSGSGNNKPCNTSENDPEPQDFPISDNIINKWKADAELGGIITGNYQPTGSESSLGPVKITGNLTIPVGHTLTLTGIVWVEGRIVVSNGAEIHLDSSFGSNSGVFLADKYIDLNNNIDFFGSGTEGSFILVLSTSDCPQSSFCNGNDAIEMGNNSNVVVLNAQNGTITLKNNAGANEVTAKKIILENNATITYEEGLANSSFITGPSGSWHVESWRETE